MLTNKWHGYLILLGFFPQLNLPIESEKLTGKKNITTNAARRRAFHINNRGNNGEKYKDAGEKP